MSHKDTEGGSAVGVCWRRLNVMEGLSLSFKEGPDEVTHTILARGDNNISKAESNAERGRDQEGRHSHDGLVSVL